MDVKEAVRTAKEYLADLFVDEEVVNIGLEEVVFDDATNRWSITIGFSRPWDHAGQRRQHALITTLSETTAPRARSYKVLRINGETRQVESLRDRFLKAS